MGQEERDNSRFVNVKMLEWKWKFIVNHCHLDQDDYVVTSVKIEDGLFDGDESHKRLAKEAYKANKALRDYEFEKRHGK